MAYTFSTGTPFPTTPTTPTPGTEPLTIAGKTGEEWITIGEETVSLWQRITGQTPTTPWRTPYNNEPYKLCPNTPNFDAVLRAVQRAPATDIGRLVSYLRDANRGQGPGTREELAIPKYLPNWVKAMMGGKDCKASTFPDAPAWFANFVGTYGAPTTAEEAAPGGGALPYVPATLPGGSVLGGALPLAAAGLALWFVPRILARGGARKAGAGAWRL